MRDISTIETLKINKKFPGSRHKFPGKREISEPQISWEISRLDFPGGNTTENCPAISQNLQILVETVADSNFISKLKN